MARLTSGFAWADLHIAAVKAVIIRRLPSAQLIDVTRKNRRHVSLAESLSGDGRSTFLTGTVHLAAVDRRAGSRRRLLASAARLLKASRG